MYGAAGLRGSLGRLSGGEVMTAIFALAWARLPLGRSKPCATLPEEAILPDTLEQVVSAVVVLHGKPLYRTKLAKLLYLVDLTAFDLYGRTLTDLEYTYDYYGPYSAAIANTADRLAAEGRIRVQATKTYYGNPAVVYFPVTETRTKLGLTAPELDLVRRVIDGFGSMTVEQIKVVSKQTLPFKTAGKFDKLEMSSAVDRARSERVRRSGRVTRSLRGAELMSPVTELRDSEEEQALEHAMLTSIAAAEE